MPRRPVLKALAATCFLVAGFGVIAIVQTLALFVVGKGVASGGRVASGLPVVVIFSAAFGFLGRGLWRAADRA